MDFLEKNWKEIKSLLTIGVQREIATKIGVSENTVSVILKNEWIGKQYITSETVQRVVALAMEKIRQSKVKSSNLIEEYESINQPLA